MERRTGGGGCIGAAHAMVMSKRAMGRLSTAVIHDVTMLQRYIRALTRLRNCLLHPTLHSHRRIRWASWVEVAGQHLPNDQCPEHELLRECIEEPVNTHQRPCDLTPWS